MEQNEFSSKNHIERSVPLYTKPNGFENKTAILYHKSVDNC